VAVCLRCVKNRLSHNFKPQHVVSICIRLFMWPFQPFVFYQRQNSHDIFCLMRQNRQYLFNMSYLEFFGVLTGVGVHVSKFFEVGTGAGILKRGAGAESEKCYSAQLWHTVRLVRKLQIVVRVGRESIFRPTNTEAETLTTGPRADIVSFAQCISHAVSRI